MIKFTKYIYDLNLPNVPWVDGYVEISHIDPLEHPVLYLYEYIEKTKQYMVTHKVPYVALLKCAGYTDAIRPLTKIKVDMPDEYLFKIPWSRTTNYKIGKHYSFDVCVTLQIIAKDKQMRNTVSWMLNRVKLYGTDGVLKLLEHNNVQLTPVQQTRVDFDYFTRKYPTHDVPQQWFSFDPLEVPDLFDLPIQNGVVHMSFMGIREWISFQCKKNAITLHTEYIAGKIKSPMLDEFNKRLTVKKRSRAVDVTQYDIEDMDQLMDQMAPCLINLIQGGRRYPKNDDRTRLVPILREGGVPLETTIELFNKLHERSPNGARSGIKRWDPSYYWKKSKNDAIRASGCGKMQTCPFKNQQNPKVLCTKEFKQRFPDKEADNLWSPVSWFKWINKK